MLRILLRKASKAEILQQELLTNPHFARAFPHLALEPADDYPKVGWGDTLLFQKRPLNVSNHELEDQLDKTFVEGYRTIPGPVKWMPAEEKERIHAQIELKMDQLEDTGLSRQEILVNKPGGIPLGQDPVFQYLRKNRLAREMILKPGEEFTAYKVVDYALRQDFGPDLANVADITPTYEDQTEPSYISDIKRGERYPQLIEPRDYYWQDDLKGKGEKFRKYFGRTPLVFIDPIESRGKVYKRNKRQISKKDIHYKNTEFLSQFMSDSGFILNRLQTRLPEKVQRKVAKAIKHAKALNLFPSRGFILPVHKLNLVPIHAQDFQDIAIHCETGAVLSRAYRGEISRFNTQDHPNTVEKIAKRFKMENHTEDLTDNIRRTEKILNYDIQFFPSKEQVDIIEIHENLKMRREVDEKFGEKLVKAVEKLDSFDFHEGFLFESGASLELFNEKEKIEPQASVEEGLERLREMKEKFGIEENGLPAFYQRLVQEKPYKNSLF